MVRRNSAPGDLDDMHYSAKIQLFRTLYDTPTLYLFPRQRIHTYKITTQGTTTKRGNNKIIGTALTNIILAEHYYDVLCAHYLPATSPIESVFVTF